MNYIKCIFFVFILAVFFLFSAAPAVYAVGILPRPSGQCETIEDGKKIIHDPLKTALSTQKIDRGSLNDIIGCAIKTGRIKLFMVPFFITYLIQFLLQLAGLIAVLFMVYGGYKYAVGGLIEDKESGKKTVMHALLGLIVALSAWMVINFIQIALTS